MIGSVIESLCSLEILTTIVIGSIAGLVIGALPGLSASMAVAILVPFTFRMEATSGIVLLATIYTTAIYGGSFSACLLHTPGTPASAATTLDGYPLTQKGLGLKAISISTIASVIGGAVSAVVLLIVAPQLAKVSLFFSSLEYFLLACFGLTLVGSMVGDTPIKGYISALLGLLFGVIGLDIKTGEPRLTFGFIELESGIELVPMMIGLFSLSQALIIIQGAFNGHDRIAKTKIDYTSSVLPSKDDLSLVLPTIARSTIIGVLIGILPGAGGDIGSWLSYNIAKKRSKHPEDFGKGSLEGIAASEAANNAVTGGALIPLLTLGIPGSGTTAIMLGALTMKGIVPGYNLFYRNGDMVYVIIIGLLLANIIMGVIGLLIAKPVVKLCSISTKILCPIIVALSIMGAFAINSSVFDVFVMFFFGIFGYLMIQNGFPVAPLALGMILGPMAEKNWRQTLVISRGDLLSYFFNRPIAILLMLLIIVTLLRPIIRKGIFKVNSAYK